MPELIEDGPDIPACLLNGLDDGNVVFFCGAGVSMAEGSDLPNFADLVKHVYAANNVQCDSAEKQAFRRKDWDKVLDLLERECRLGADQLRRTVTKRLSRPPCGDLKLHKALADLSRTERGVRLVTTNFDNRFAEAVERFAEAAEESLTVDVAPRLPIPKRHDWSSLVHLHGIASKEDGSNLVLTAADFGRAYLTERWAARFVTELFREFSVVFVGYSLDDPVMGYMVDALAAERSKGAGFGTAWAFAAMDGSEVGISRARDAWVAKNVEPILYDERDGHRLLADTLIEWARIRSDPLRARSRIAIDEINKMPAGPVVERVVWALQDASAARALAEAPPISNEEDHAKFEKWLDMFAEKGLLRFAADGADRHLVHTGLESVNPGNLDTTRCHLSVWLANHLHVPQLLAWALRNGGHLHPHLRQQVESRLAEQASALPDIPDRLRLLWTVLLGSRPDDPWNGLWFSDRHQAATSPDERRLIEDKVMESIRPRLVVRPGLSMVRQVRLNYENTPQAPQPIDTCGHLELMSACDRVWALFKAILDDREVLSRHAETLTDHLEHALSLGKADGNVCQRSYLYRPSIAPHEQNNDFDNWTRLIDLVQYSYLALVPDESRRARNLLLRWADSDEPLFRRLALHALTENPRADIRLARKLLLGGRNPGLWDFDMRRETMRFLRLAGKRLPRDLRSDIIDAIHAGPKLKKIRESFGSDEGLRKEQALFLYKMDISGVNLNKKSRALAEAIAQKMEEIEGEIDEFLGEVKYERIGIEDYAPKHLLKGSVEDIVVALDTGEIVQGGLRGLAARKPVKVVSALRRLGKQGKWPVRYWREFLWELPEPKYPARLHACAARILAEAPGELFGEAASAVAGFVKQLADAWKTDREAEFDVLWTKSWTGKGEGESEMADQDETLTNALNHPAGKLAEAALTRLSKYEPPAGTGFPPPVRPYFDAMAEDPLGHPGRVLLATRLRPLFAVDPKWTRQHLIARLACLKSQEAVDLWSAYSWSLGLGPDLLKAIRAPFLEILRDDRLKDRRMRRLRDLFMAVCLDAPGELTEREIRDVVDEMPEQGLVTVLDSLRRRLTGTPDERQRIWDEKLHRWLCSYWPREQGRNTAKISEAILKMLAECGDAFPQAAEWWLTYLRPVEGSGGVGQSFFVLNRNGCAKQHPEPLLKVLNKVIDVLPDYNKPGLKKLLDAMCAGNCEISRDLRFQKLYGIATQ